jgi:hypothetical protein
MTALFTTHYDEADVAMRSRLSITADCGARHCASLKERTGTTNLEDAFITLTGHAIREEEAGTQQRMRDFSKAWTRQR